MSQQTTRVDSIESAEPASKNAPHVDAWDLPDHTRSIIARIAVVTGADAEDLIARKDILNGWAEDVDSILDILNIKWIGIPSIADPRLGEWHLVPISSEVAEGLAKTFTEAANSEASGERLSDEWIADRDRIRAELISDFLEIVIQERLPLSPSTATGEEPAAAGAAADTPADIDVASYEFAYLPKYDKELILSFAEMCGAREDAAVEYRFLEDLKFREERIRQILANEHFPPAENLKGHFSNESIELYEDWYVRAVSWFQEVLPGLLGDVDQFPPYCPPAAGTVDPVVPAGGLEGEGSSSKGLC